LFFLKTFLTIGTLVARSLVARSLVAQLSSARSLVAAL